MAKSRFIFVVTNKTTIESPNFLHHDREDNITYAYNGYVYLQKLAPNRAAFQ